MANDLIRPAVTFYRETDPKIDMMAPVTTMNRIAQVIQRRSRNNIVLFITLHVNQINCMLYIILILILFMPRIKQMTQNLPAYIQVSFFFF